MRSEQEEITEDRRHLQARTTELEAVKSTKDSLERQRSELEDRLQADIASYQEAILQLDAQQLPPSEYLDLLNAKEEEGKEEEGA
ncbi:hypothetical protein P7K49_000407 [Saguinus oedipus]|uniref:IF rod domain-containing protein n=1 Tax=Saguinus oedipus TaxID=9490 RepID=A0ABQ9WBL0_SAGOE|nr:hypothetical protein P7K49_000407 [Saguinus oedipus]